MSVFQLGRYLGTGFQPFVLAAVDGAKLTKVDQALAVIDAATDSGLDAVKMRGLPQRWARQLFDYAEKRGTVLIPTVSDEASIERLDWFGSPAFEIFFDWADLDLVRCAARTNKPLLLSVANASAFEVANVVELAHDEGAGGVALVQRVLDASLGLGCLERLRGHDAVLGISDRWTNPGSVRAAILEGASLIEMRVGPQPTLEELSALARSCESAWSLVGGHADCWATN
ncbi:MAG TPA: N-acetylneuraminate synthase family protein [Kofleriaceae bacterium]